MVGSSPRSGHKLGAGLSFLRGFLPAIKTPMTQLNITNRPVDALIPYARNSRTHSDAQVAKIAGSLREFGWTNPVLVDGESGIIAGHGRVLAVHVILKAGATIANWDDPHQVPTIELRHMTEAQKRAYVIADNRLAELAGWDD